MSEQGITFEKFFPRPLAFADKAHELEMMSKWNDAKITWETSLEAAAAEANKRIAELTQDRNDLNYLCMERLHKIEALEGTVTRLRARLIAEKELLYDQIKIDMKTSRENEQLKVKNSELEGEVAELKRDRDEWKDSTISANCRFEIAENDVYKYQVETANMSLEIMQLQKNNHDLREALEFCRFSGEPSVYRKADKALSATPVESLQAFENELIEKCAKVADAYVGQECLANAIRALKEVK